MQSGVLQQLLIYTLNSNHREAKEEYKGILTSMNSEAMGFFYSKLYIYIVINNGFFGAKKLFSVRLTGTYLSIPRSSSCKMC